ncbi:hypothetical protein SALBM217S_04357 [Streptomyces griseoloalbus]
MASDAPTAQVSDLDWLMSGLVQRVPHTRSAVLLSYMGAPLTDGTGLVLGTVAVSRRTAPRLGAARPRRHQGAGRGTRRAAGAPGERRAAAVTRGARARARTGDA